LTINDQPDGKCGRIPQKASTMKHGLLKILRLEIYKKNATTFLTTTDQQDIRRIQSQIQEILYHRKGCQKPESDWI